MKRVGDSDEAGPRLEFVGVRKRAPSCAQRGVFRLVVPGGDLVVHFFCFRRGGLISESGQKDSQKTEIEELFDGLKSMNCDLNLLQKNTINEKGIRRSTRQRKTPLRFTEEFKEDIQKCLLDDIPPEELPVALGLGSDDDGDSCAGSFCADEEEDEDYEICTDESSEVSLEDDDDDQDEDGVVDEDEENDEENDDELLLPNGQRV